MPTHRSKSAATLAICIELPPSASAPEQVQVLPPGPDIVGLDGRTWNLADPAALAAAMNGHAAIPLDWEHATELLAPAGHPSPAAAWLSEWRVQSDNSIWAKAEWTAKGESAVANREHRWLSPAFFYDKAGNITKIVSAGLTNRPNLPLTALNHRQEPPVELATLNEQLGLADGTDEATALNSLAKLRTDRDAALVKAAQPPDLKDFVPRADYDLAVNRAATAEQTLRNEHDRRVAAAAEAAVDGAVEAGKITPATRDYHLAQCRQEGGMERFAAFLEATPVVVGGETGTDVRPAHNTRNLTEDDMSICRQLGLDPDKYATALNIRQEAAAA